MLESLEVRSPELMELSTDSSSGAAAQKPHLPPGFRFHPTDEELVVHYLKKKASSAPLPVTIITDIDLYKFDPWELPGKATFGEQEWYFFSPRERKYPNGARPNRAATSGYWKATGTDKPILTSGGTQKVGVKKALVFYGGKPPKGIKTNWIMHEYRLADSNSNSNKPPCYITNKNSSLRLDDWVLCRIYKKNSSQRMMDRESREDSIDDMLPPLPSSSVYAAERNFELQNNIPKGTNSYGAALLDNDENFFQGLLTTSQQLAAASSSSCSATSSKPVDFSTSMVNQSLSAQAAAMNSTTTSVLKRAHPPSTYWAETGLADPQSSKRFHAGHEMNDGRVLDGSANMEGSNNTFPIPIGSLLNQPVPQSSTSNNSFNHQLLLGSLGEGFFRQPYQVSGMNWNS